MKRRAGLIGGLLIAALLAIPRAGLAAGVDDFKLAKVIPADAMIVVHARDHAGRKFVDEQMKRVWAAIEKQHFDRDIRKLLRTALTSDATTQSVEAFDQQWDQVAELAAKVQWSRLMEREMALGVRIGAPPEFVLVMMPPAENVAADFEGLTGLFKSLAAAAPEHLAFNTEGEGERTVGRLSLQAESPVPVTLTLAREREALLIGFGTGLVEQCLALLRGETGTFATGTERFKQAFQRLPAPKDGFSFVDVTRIMAEGRSLVDMLLTKVQADESGAAAEQLGFLKPLLAQLDLWDHVAGVAETDGMKTNTTSMIVLRDTASDLPLRKAFYSGDKLKDPFKYVPKEATSVGAYSGFDLLALYNGILDFIRKEVPEGASALEQFEAAQQEAEFNVEKDLLSWLGGSFMHFSSARGPYASDFLITVAVRDEATARQTLETLSEKINEALAQQQGGIDDAEIEGAEGFKLLILPGPFALMLPIGQPVFGIKDGHLFLASSTKVVELALATAAGQHENFTKSERYQKESLPLPENATSYSFADMSKLGEELSTALTMAQLPMQFMGGGGRDQATTSILNIVRKIGTVVKTLDFYRSSSEATTFDGKASVTKTLLNYQEPPRPARPGAAPEGAATQPAEGAEPGK